MSAAPEGRLARSGVAHPPAHARSFNDVRGFVLPFVVFMLFAISVTGVTGYLIVNSEFALAKHSSDGAKALTVARAGLERFVAEEIGVVGDSVSYALGDGVALITTRKLFAQDSVTDVYYVRSEGTVADIFAPNSPATRVVGAYATHRKRPLPHYAAFMLSSSTVTATANGEIHGIDKNVSTDCAGGGASPIIGAISRSTFVEDSVNDIQGSPEFRAWPGGAAAMRDSIGIRWDVLSDPDFPVDYDGVWPNFGALPVDSFPIVRMSGWVYANQVGRGVLIIDGMFDPGTGFEWDGIVLAGLVDDYIEGDIRGMLIGGLWYDNTYTNVQQYGGDVHYYSCNVYAANETLSYLELVDGTVFESY